jgi:fumarate hydratase class II
MLAAGGTAVGTGLNTRVGFAEKVAAKVTPHLTVTPLSKFNYDLKLYLKYTVQLQCTYRYLADNIFPLLVLRGQMDPHSIE